MDKVPNNGQKAGRGSRVINQSPNRQTSKSKADANKKKVGIAVAIIASIALIAGIVLAVLNSGSGNTVPDVVGKTQTEATQIIAQQGFKVGQITYTNSETVEAGKVISQNPNAGLKREPNTAISLVVSQGTESVNVPNLSNMTADEAQAALQKAGLKGVAGNPVHSSTVEEGKVASQNPSSGQPVNKGTTVEYCLSLGPEAISVPNVVNYSESQAAATLKDAGFTVEIQRGYSNSVDAGYVYKQNPSSGKHESGSTVTIYVSKGKQQSSVPNVCGMTVSAARSVLQNAGFNVTVSEGSDSDVVYSQTPSSGTQADSGSTVRISARAANNTNNTSNSNTRQTAEDMAYADRRLFALLRPYYLYH